jgi:hypothetical protein
MATETERITPLLAGMDTVYFSCDLPMSDVMRERLIQEKAIAQTRAAQRQVHCPEWLEARIAPQGAKGGYAFLIETEDFSVKLLGEHIQKSSQRLHRDALACAPYSSRTSSRGM